MDKIYDFNWMVRDIDISIIFMLSKDNHVVSGYQVYGILSTDMNELAIKFANVDDLTNFVNYAVVRFVDVKNNNNIIDIPVRKLSLLYKNANKIEEGTSRKKIKLNELECFSVLNEEAISDGYLIEAINFNDVSDELTKVMDITANYFNMGMQEKFDALANINLINYQREKVENVQSR